jgi:hypothetical protein
MQSWVSCKSFHLYDVEFGLCLSVKDVVSHPSRCDLTVWGSMLWFEQWLEWWRWLIPSWHVVLKSAKDRILAVDTSGQHVPPRVRCGMACLIIRNTIGSLFVIPNFLYQNQVHIICMTLDQWFDTYGPKVFTDNEMSQIKYNYYISNVSKDYDDSQWNEQWKTP